MKTNDIKNQTPVIITILPFLSMLMAILPSVISQTAGIGTVKIGIITLLLTGAVVFYIRANADDILNKKLAKTIITVSYLGSICLLLFIPDPSTFSFWMIGGLLVSMLIDNKLGLILHFNLAFIMGLMVIKNPEQIIRVLIIGILLSMLSSSLKNKSTVIYSIIIILSLNLTISFVINNLNIETMSNYNYLKAISSIFLVIFADFIISMIYFNNFGKEGAAIGTVTADQIQGMTSENPNDLSAELTKNENSNMELNLLGEPDLVAISLEAQVIEDSYIENDRTSYEVLCNLNNELLMKLKQFSENLYSHSLFIGDLSSRAAKEIGANDMLAFAGGLYHEIGKINGKNYIEEGLNIADEHAFPKELKAIMKEHNIKYEKPSSIEAAIVMLSDSVVSTIEYIEKNNDHRYTTNKVIDNIFQMRMDKGTFDAATFSLKDYKSLKEFYQKEFDEMGQA